MKSTLVLSIFATLCTICQAQHYNAKENDIVINEIMADPTPTASLPPWEYVELYNASEEDINIKGWTIAIGSSEYRFTEDLVFRAEEYLILCHNDGVEELSRYGRCQGFPSFKITNSGCELALTDEEGFYISQVTFEMEWHSAAHKEEGGWSLEQIDPGNPCAGKRNWSSSLCVAGGTPGSKNSVNGNNIIKPKVDYVCLLTDNIIEIHYNQRMNAESITDVNNYTVTEMSSSPSEAYVTANDNSCVELVFVNDFDDDRLYTLTIDNISNCKDISADETIGIVFGRPKIVEANDIVINEILFHPINGCVEYLELYNRSDKVVDMSTMMVGTIKTVFPNPPDTSLKEICFASRPLLPHSYLLLSTDGDIVKSYYNSDAECFLDMKSSPTFPNEEGIVIICDKTRKLIDIIHYSDKMHYDLLTTTQGVSLERISPDKASADDDNWHSASFDTNYGTPGYKNSMAYDIKHNHEDIINITPEIFSPDGDGRNDNCGIHCTFDKEAYSLNIKIFDTEGNMIRELLHNSLVGQEICIIWDGCDDNRHIVSPGIYIILAEYFDLNGNVTREKKVVTVATS